MVIIRILFFDLETSPNLADVWSLWNVNVGLSQLRETGQVIAFSAKWRGEKQTIFRSAFHDGKEAMILEAHALLTEADAIVTYNGISFDRKWLNQEFLLADLTPPPPTKDIDLYRVVKKNFRFPSNKLQHVSTRLGLKGKVSHYGHELWIKCMAGDEKAWSLMKRYAIQDTKLLEPMYERLLPWISNHPNVALIDDVEGKCRCGKVDTVVKEGFYSTQAAVYQQYSCAKSRGGCGSWFHGRSALRTTELRGESL